MLALLGVPLALLWGLLVFITNYIPYIGFWIGLVPPVLLALLTGGWELAAVVFVLYTVVNFVLTSVIQPKYVGDAVGISVSLTLVALVFWGWVLGTIGAVLAVPLTLFAKALLVDVNPRVRWAERDPRLDHTARRSMDDAGRGTAGRRRPTTALGPAGRPVGIRSGVVHDEHVPARALT